MRQALVFAVLLLASAPAALAQEKPLTAADVAVQLRPGDSLGYPKAAQAAGVEGKARAVCVVSRFGSLKDCKVVSESPAGYDFGAELLKFAKDMHVAGRTRDGAPTAGRLFSFGTQFTLAPNT